ncbi:hypothetical protein [Methanooceanicella nereidis]|nr:hypothetical protein [Methanocella sp. CWC-04]
MISFSRDFPEIEDAEGYIEVRDYFDPKNIKKKYFYRVGDGLNINFVNCEYVDCDGVYSIKHLISAAYRGKAVHIEGYMPCPVCQGQGRQGYSCEAKFSLDIVYKG